MPLVVACMPTWNAADVIEDSLQALLNQTYGNLKILISDDCSDDSTVSLCRQLAATDPRVIISVQPTNLGWINNVNSLLARAEGDYVLIAADDDWLHPEYVARLTAALERDPGVILAFSDVDVSYPHGRLERSSYRQLDNVASPVIRGAKILLQVQTNWWIPYRGVFRRKVLDDFPGLKHHRAGEFSADWPWVLGLALRGRFTRVPVPLCHKRLTKDSLSESWDFSLSSWISVDHACIKVIYHTDLASYKKLFLYSFAILFIPRKAVALLVRCFLKQFNSVRP